MKLELMPAIISAAADTFLVLLGNSRGLSDTFSTSVVLKIKKILGETALLDLLCLSKEENDT